MDLSRDFSRLVIWSALVFNIIIPFYGPKYRTVLLHVIASIKSSFIYRADFLCHLWSIVDPEYFVHYMKNRKIGQDNTSGAAQYHHLRSSLRLRVVLAKS